MNEPNYYQHSGQQDNLHYRLDATELINHAIDTFKGGVIEVVNGKKIYNTDHRLMNDLGIARARMILEAGVNKINHLTKYKDEDRVFRQVKSMVKSWIYEVALNMKKWSPESTFTKEGKLVNVHSHKVRNKHLVIQVVENALLQSMLRGTAGFEAELTGKQMQVIETNQRQEFSRDDMHSMGGMFGGRGGNY